MPSRETGMSPEHVARLKAIMEAQREGRDPSPMDDLHQIDPERYKRLAAPFHGTQEFETALSGFFKELGALREKYEIPDVHVAALAFVKDEKSDVVEQRMATMQYGNTSLRPFIVLSLYRQEHPMLQALFKGLTGSPKEAP